MNRPQRGQALAAFGGKLEPEARHPLLERHGVDAVPVDRALPQRPGTTPALKTIMIG